MRTAIHFAATKLAVAGALSVGALLSAAHAQSPCPVTFTASDAPAGAAPRNLPVTLAVCQTNSCGQCINPATPGASFTVNLNQNDTVTWSTFVTGTGTLAEYNAATRRIYTIGRQGANVVTSTSAALKMTTESGNFTIERTGTTAPPLLAAVLPNARTTAPGNAVTAFATIINTGFGATFENRTAQSCSIKLPTGVDASLSYQTTDDQNALTGIPNFPVDIQTFQPQSFVFSVRPNSAFTTDIPLVFSCANRDPVTPIGGINTLLLTSSTTPLADPVAVSVTPSRDGNVVVRGATGTGVIGSAAVNLRACAPPAPDAKE